jgi:hypothetical protein
MPRKPISELAGGQSPRQRIWANIRKCTGEFTWKDVTPGDVIRRTAQPYLDSLIAAGYLALITTAPACYLLVRDNGIEAPRVHKDGSEVTQGCGNEAIWGAISVLDTFNTQTIADLSGAAPGTVKHYCMFLERAGYLTVAIKGKGRGKGGVTTTYRTIKSRISGPRAPMITRLKAVYDPNMHQVVWSEGADEAVKEMDHA